MYDSKTPTFMGVFKVKWSTSHVAQRCARALWAHFLHIRKGGNLNTVSHGRLLITRVIPFWATLGTEKANAHELAKSEQSIQVVVS